jgi:adenylate cyclase
MLALPPVSAPLTALQRQRLLLYLRILAYSTAIGAVFGVFLAPSGTAVYGSALIGAANALLIAGSISAIETFVLREGSSMSRLARLPFAAVVALKTLTYGGIIAALVVGTQFLVRLLPLQGGTQPLERNSTLVIIGFSLAMTAIFVLVLQVAALLGRRTFRNLVLGRYRQPRAERRFFLFVDVIGSTAIAERLGPMQAHRFLAAVFSATAEPVAACRGEIYQYIGDEIVVTWTEADGIADARPLRCFFLMEEALLRRKDQFRADFSAQPGLRAALHLGEVIAGEVGESRRAIVFHGDVMNTASRLEQATRELGVRFIASEAALQALGPQPDIELADLGALALRGRKEPIRAWRVELSR